MIRLLARFFTGPLGAPPIASLPPPGPSPLWGSFADLKNHPPLALDNALDRIYPPVDPSAPDWPAVIEVTAEDLRTGIPSEISQCPIALAVKRALPWAVIVYVSTLIYVTDATGQRYFVHVPPSLWMTIHDIDAGLPVRPFSFPVRLIRHRDDPTPEQVQEAHRLTCGCDLSTIKSPAAEMGAI
jgi:hypothetical protein